MKNIIKGFKKNNKGNGESVIPNEAEEERKIEFQKKLFKILNALIWTVLFVVVTIFITTEGEAYAALMKQLPFYDVYKLIVKIVGYEDSLPDISTQAVSISIVKALLTATVKGILFSILVLIFNPLFGFQEAPEFTDSTSRAKWINKMEDKLETAYTLVRGVFTFLATLGSALLVNKIVDKANEKLDSLGGALATVIAVGVLVGACLIYSWIYALRDKRDLRYGFLRLYMIRIIPQLISLFIIDMLCFWLYEVYTGFGVSFIYVVVFICIAIYSSMDRTIRKKLAGLFLKLTRDKEGTDTTQYKKKSGVSLGQLILWLLCVVCSLMLAYLMILVTNDQTADSLFSFYAFPFVMNLLMNYSIGAAFMSMSIGFWSAFFTLVIISMAVALVVKKPLVTGLGGMALYVVIWGGVSLLVSVAVNKAMYWLLTQDSSDYNGIFVVVVCVILFAMLLYNRQVVIVAVLGAALILCIMQILMAVGIPLGALKADLASGGASVWAAFAVLFAISCFGGAFCYGFRKR